MEFLEELGVVGAAIALTLSALINSVVLWIVVNYMVKEQPDTKFMKCLPCSICLAIFPPAGAYLMALIPLPLIGVVLAIFVWYKLSMIIIESFLEIPGGSLMILIVYYLMVVLIGWGQITMFV